MSVFQQYVIVCNKCGAVYRARHAARTQAGELRVEAIRDGWTHVYSSITPTAPMTSNDFCPPCSVPEVLS